MFNIANIMSLQIILDILKHRNYSEHHPSIIKIKILHTHTHAQKPCVYLALIGIVE